MPVSEKQNQKPLGVSFWERHVKGFKASGLSQGEFCRRNRLKLSAFGYWYRKLNSHASEKILAKKNGTYCKRDFIEVSNLMNKQTQSSNLAQTCLEIELRNGWKIRIPAGWESESLKQLLALLREEACL